MNSRIFKLKVSAIAAVAVTMAHTQQTAAQTFDSGKDDYDRHCAACHGSRGAGDGPKARFLNVTVPDLTTLSKRNGGVFPYSRVYLTIDGRLQLPAHGTGNMPIWGQELSDKKRLLNPNIDPQAHVRAKITALVLYIHTLEVK